MWGFWKCINGKEERFKLKTNNQTYCDKCQKEIKRENTKIRVQNFRNKEKCNAK